MAKRKTSKKRVKAEEPEATDFTPKIDPDSRIEDQVPLNELPTLFPNSYEVVVAAARRARQLNLGLKPLVETQMKRPVDIALAELAAGKVEYGLGEEEQKRGRKKSKKKS
jgi:DNA-directed RNA polymerase omega subunit